MAQQQHFPLPSSCIHPQPPSRFPGRRSAGQNIAGTVNEEGTYTPCFQHLRHPVHSKALSHASQIQPHSRNRLDRHSLTDGQLFPSACPERAFPFLIGRENAKAAALFPQANAGPQRGIKSTVCQPGIIQGQKKHPFQFRRNRHGNAVFRSIKPGQTAFRIHGGHHFFPVDGTGQSLPANPLRIFRVHATPGISAHREHRTHNRPPNCYPPIRGMRTGKRLHRRKLRFPFLPPDGASNRQQAGATCRKSSLPEKGTHAHPRGHKQQPTPYK